jgi:hypothetical protein
MAACLGPAFEVTAGVRQGCVAAPMLFNVFMDHVIKKALSRMPDDCRVHKKLLPPVNWRWVKESDGT